MSAVDPNEDPPIEENLKKDPVSETPLGSDANVETTGKTPLKPSENDDLASGDSSLVNRGKIMDESIKNDTENQVIDSTVATSSDDKKTPPKPGKDDMMDVQDDDIELKWDDDEEIDEDKLLADDSTGDETKIQEGSTETSKIAEGNDKQDEENADISTTSEKQHEETDLPDEKTESSEPKEISQKDIVVESSNADKNDQEINKDIQLEDDINLKQNMEENVKAIAAIVENKEHKLEVDKCELMDVDEIDETLDNIDNTPTANSTIIDNDIAKDEVTSNVEENPVQIQHNLKKPDVMIEIPTQELIDLPDESGTSNSKDSIDNSQDRMDTDTIESGTDDLKNNEKLSDETSISESVENDDAQNKDKPSTTTAATEQDANKEENVTKLADNNLTVDSVAKDTEAKVTETAQKSDTIDVVKDSKDEELVTQHSNSDKGTNNDDKDPNMAVEIADSNEKGETNKSDESQIKEDTSLKTDDIEEQLDLPESNDEQNVDTSNTPMIVIENPISIADNIEMIPVSSDEITTASKDLSEIVLNQNIETPKEHIPELTQNVEEITNVISMDNLQDIGEDNIQIESTESIKEQNNEAAIDSTNETELPNQLDTSVGTESGVNTDTTTEQKEPEQMNFAIKISVRTDLHTAVDNAEDSGIQTNPSEPTETTDNDDQPDTSDEVPEMTDSLGLLAESSWKEDEQDSSGGDEGDGDGDDDEFDPDEADESNLMGIDNSEDSNAQVSESDVPNKQTDAQPFADIGKMKGVGDGDRDGEKDGALEAVDDVVCDEMEIAATETMDESLDQNVPKDDEAIDDSLVKAELKAEADDEPKDSLLEKILTSGKETPKKRKLSLSTASSRHVVNMVWLEGSSSDEDQKTTEETGANQPEAGSITTVNIPSDIEVMSSGENTSDITTKEGEVLISGVPKPSPAKPSRLKLNTGEITIKTTTNSDASKVQSSTDAALPKLSPEVFSLDSDEEERPDKSLIVPAAHKNKKCVNTTCTSDSSAQFYIACPSTIAYYDVNKVDKCKRAMVCEECLQVAYSRSESLIEGIKNFTPLLNLDLGKTGQELVEISDSDSDSELDSALASEEPLGTIGAKFVKEQLADIMNEMWYKYYMDERLQFAEDKLSEEMARLEKESTELDEMLKQCQRDTDTIRNELYRTFEPERKELTPVIVYDTPNNLYTCPENSVIDERVTKRRLSDPPEMPAKKVYAPVTYERKEKKVQEIKDTTETTENKDDDDDKDVSVVHLSAEAAPPSLPPPGTPKRPPLQVGQSVFVMRSAFGTWHRAKVLEVFPKWQYQQKSSEMVYTNVKIKLENKGKQCIKTIEARYLAYDEPCEVRMTIGTRMIALFKGPEVKKDSFYSGIISEVPNPVNSYRYLIFFDDGYAQYVQHADTRLVVECSPLVWEEVHPFSREFVKQYLRAYPERPMVRLHPGQTVKCELNGQWLTCRVTKVDASLAEIVFPYDNRKEWIYRGSTRLQLLYRELQAAERKGRFNNKNRAIVGANMPYVEYTRTDDKPVDQQTTAAQQEELRRQQRAVAKKSMGAPQPAAPNAAPHIDSSTSRVVYYTPKLAVRPHKMVPHSCGPHCRRTDVLALKELRTYNPLAKPLLSGWERQTVRFKGQKEVMYRAPCGRRLRSPAELHRYLRLTNSELPVDLFDFAPNTHCLAEFVLNKCIIAKKDLSNGKENVPVPCVNYYDRSLPGFCSYNTERTPTQGVPLNLDPEFLCGCDCTDDCEDKSKCACWQMTLEGARTIGLEGDVGYEYKRLLEPLPTGIYECNSRCKCKSTCLNRVAQHPLQLKLQVFKTLNRGWGIRALNDIPRGAFICVYAGNLLTDATANLDGLNEGDEYLAELDYIEVVEQIKEGYEDDVPDADKELDKKESNQEEDSCSSSSEEDNIPEREKEDDGDFHPGYLPHENYEFNKRLRKRDKGIKKENKEDDKKEKDSEKKDDDDDCITISDDDEVREPSRFTAQDGMAGGQFTSKYKSVRTLFGKDEKCYIMDAKVQGNIGRYLNHSCTPNVFVQNVFVDTHDPRFPWVGFFALSAVKAGSELTWNYNYDVGSVPGKVLYCYCGAPNCRGRLL